MKTFVDSGVLITAAQGRGELGKQALRILSDPKRTFFASDFLRLEVLPKAIYHRQHAEADFYRAFFESAVILLASPQLTKSAQILAETNGLSAVDALHIAAAQASGIDEFITTEKLTKPMFRVSEFKVIYMADAALIS